MNPSFSESEALDLGAIVRAELAAYEAGAVPGIASNKTLAKIHGTTPVTIRKYLEGQLSPEDRERRIELLTNHYGPSKEERQLLIGLVREELQEFQNGVIDRLSTAEELGALIYNNPDDATRKYISKILTKNLTKEELAFRRDAIWEQTGAIVSRTKLGWERPTKEALAGLIAEHSLHELARALEIPFPTIRHWIRDYGLELGEKSFDTRSKISYEQRFQNGLKGGRIGGLRSAASLKGKKYFVEGRFRTQSKQEGAVALLLEHYVPGYAVAHGENYQIRDKGISNGGLDFLVDGEFLEWHPIILAGNSDTLNKRRGDIPKEQVDTYLQELADASLEQKRLLKTSWKAKLEAEYLSSRQAAVNSSGYAGANVTLATTVEELYSFIGRYTEKLPPLNAFRKEFRNKVSYVGQFREANE